MNLILTYPVKTQGNHSLVFHNNVTPTRSELAYILLRYLLEKIGVCQIFTKKKKLIIIIKDTLSFMCWGQGVQTEDGVFLKHSTFYKLNLLSKNILKLMHKCRTTRQWMGLTGEWQLSGMIVCHHGNCMVYRRQTFKDRSSWESKCRALRPEEQDTSQESE